MADCGRLRDDFFQILNQYVARLMGVGDLTGIVDGREHIGVSVAVPVPGHIVEDLKTAPTKEYYDTLNDRLDTIVKAGAQFLTKQGYSAHANTTSTVKMDTDWRTPLPHKTVATRAGLGWIGKSCCGGCKKRVEHCPANALSGASWKAGMPREELFQKEICKKVQTERMKRATGIDTDLCGM